MAPTPFGRSSPFSSRSDATAMAGGMAMAPASMPRRTNPSSTQSGIGASFYYQSVVGVVTLTDLWNGLVKTLVFGWLIAMVACHQGLSTTGGTVGVGRATTRAVVVSSIAVFVSDFFLTKVIPLW